MGSTSCIRVVDIRVLPLSHCTLPVTRRWVPLEAAILEKNVRIFEPHGIYIAIAIDKKSIQA